MTSSRIATPLVTGSLSAALTAVRARGLRVSVARRQVIEALFAADAPVSAEELAGGLRGRAAPTDLASVYRNLDALESIGLVHHVHLGHGPGLYALAGRHEEAYAACERCGRRTAIDPGLIARVRSAVHDACGYELAFAHFAIVGLCPACAARHRHGDNGTS
jgi:Fur family ferric uptake transcriptional regulator